MLRQSNVRQLHWAKSTVQWPDPGDAMTVEGCKEAESGQVML